MHFYLNFEYGDLQIRQEMIHPSSHPTYNERQQKNYRTDRLDFREI